MSDTAYTPWRAEYMKAPDKGWRIVNSLGDLVCQGTHSMFDERDFPLIARACNAHEQMLAELKNARAFMENVRLERGDHGVRILIRAADAAIAKAEERS